MAGWWQAKHALVTAGPAGLPSSNWANPHPSVEAYFFESLTMNSTPFLGRPATNDWVLPKTLLFSSEAS